MVNIVSIHIQHFGRLHDFSYQFDKEYNNISNNNSTGKSTMLAFVRAMLYGLDKTKGDKVDTDRKMYRPWDYDKKFGGSMEVVYDNMHYRITRLFGDRPASDSAELYCMDTAQVLDCDNIGKYLLGIDSDTYDKSICIGQDYSPIGNTANMQSILSNMVDGGVDNDYHTAIDKLDTARKHYKLDRGRGGIISRLEDEYDRCQHLLEQQLQNINIAKAKRQQLHANQQQIATLEAQQIELERQYGELLSNVSQPTAQQIQDQQTLSKAQQIVARSDLANIEQDYAQLTVLHTASNIKATPRLGRGLVWGLAGVLVCIAIVLSIAGWWYIGVGIAVIGCIVLMLLGRRPLPNNTSAMRDILLRYMPMDRCERIDQGIHTMYDIKTNYLNAKAIVTALHGNLKVSTVDDTQLSVMRDNIHKVKTAKENLIFSQGTLRSDIDAIDNNANIAQLREQLDSIGQQLTQATYQYNTIVLAKQYIVNAKSDMATAYLPTLTSKCSQYISTASSGQFSQVRITDTFEVSLVENGLEHDIKYFSRGIRELLLFCFRLSLSEMLYDGKIPFMVIDDAFVNLDSAKYSYAVRLLRQLSQHSQVIYVTCHDRNINN